MPAENKAQMDILFHGRIDTKDSVGYHGPVTIYSDSTGQIEAHKRLTMTPEQVLGLPAAAQAQMSTTINAIVSNKGRAFIENFAWKKACQQKPEAECIASRHAEQQFSQRMDQQAAEMIARANSDMTTQFRQPLRDYNLYPEVLRFGTTTEAMHVVALAAADGSLASPGAPPAASQQGDLVVRVHQSAINSSTTAALSGQIVTAKRFRELTKERLGSLLNSKAPAPGDDDWSITFAQQPISVGFADGKFTVTIRGLEFYSDGDTYSEPMNVTAVYEIRKTGSSFKAVRQGGLSVLPPTSTQRATSSPPTAPGPSHHAGAAFRQDPDRKIAPAEPGAVRRRPGADRTANDRLGHDAGLAGADVPAGGEEGVGTVRE